jgi:hypothetical protein
MTPEKEKLFLSALYDRLWQAITYSPKSNQPAPFDKATIFIHLSKGEVLNPTSFINLVSPINPNGDLRATELFSKMVDVIPDITANYTPSSNRVSTIYRQLLEGAIDSSPPVDSIPEEAYNRAFTFLYTDMVTRDYTGQEVTLYIPSPVSQMYENNKLAYTQALSNYRTAYLNYDLSNPRQQREWLANAPLLELAINQAYNKWRREGAAQVEQARSVLEMISDSRAKSEVNLTLQNLVKEALETINVSIFGSAIENAESWYLSYALPSNWVSLSGNTSSSHLKLSSSLLTEGESLKFKGFGGEQSWSDGLWSVEESSTGNTNLVNYHVEANEIELSANIGVTRIYRPWLNLLALKRVKQLAKAIDQETTIPSVLIPTAFITACNVRIKGDFTSKDREHLEQSFSAAKSVSLGAIRLSGKYSHSLSTELFHATEDSATIIVPGLHILAWVSEVVPPGMSAFPSG